MKTHVRFDKFVQDVHQKNKQIHMFIPTIYIVLLYMQLAKNLLTPPLEMLATAQCFKWKKTNVGTPLNIIQIWDRHLKTKEQSQVKIKPI